MTTITTIILSTDTRKGKRKPVTNLKINRKVLREAGDSHPLAEDELSLHGGSDLDEQTDCVVKAVGAISKVTNALLELKNSNNLNTTTLN